MPLLMLCRCCCYCSYFDDATDVSLSFVFTFRIVDILASISAAATVCTTNFMKKIYFNRITVQFHINLHSENILMRFNH